MSTAMIPEDSRACQEEKSRRSRIFLRTMAKNTRYAAELNLRLQQLVEAAPTIRALAKRSGLDERRLAETLRTTAIPWADLLAAIASATVCDAMWLLTGKGEMKPCPPGPKRVLPILACASAAEANGVCMVSEGAERYGESEEIPDDAHLVRVHGDSMSPLALDGQFVIVTEAEATSGDLAVIETKDGEIIFKRIQIEGEKIYCQSLNQAVSYPLIVKRVTEVRKKRKVWGVKF